MNQNISRLADSVGKVIVGKNDTVISLIAALLCEGHVLLEDVPGVGKTQLIMALYAQSAESSTVYSLLPMLCHPI